jgi:hypothetical protein
MTEKIEQASAGVVIVVERELDTLTFNDEL